MASGEVEVDRCRTCGAAWFDHGEIPAPGIPVLVPLADMSSAAARPPLAGYGILLLTVLLYLLAWIGGDWMGGFGAALRRYLEPLP